MDVFNWPIKFENVLFVTGEYRPIVDKAETMSIKQNKTNFNHSKLL